MMNIIIYVNNPPIPVLKLNQTACNLKNLFDASSSTDPDGDRLLFYWNFGDGKSITGPEVISHMFSIPGLYPVELTVDDGKNLPNSRVSSSATIFINAPPIADAGEDEVVCAGEIVQFNGNHSIDPDGDVLKYFWDFGDGNSSESINPVHIYKSAGQYVVLLKVEDQSGLECSFDTDSKIITVAGSPVADAGRDTTVCCFTEILFDGSGSTDSDGLVNSYSWDFGDGETGGGPNPKHSYKNTGRYRVLLTVTGESLGGCDNTNSDEMYVEVIEAPVAEFQAPGYYPVNQTLNLDGSSSESGSEIISYSWDFGDGNRTDGVNAAHTFTKSGKYFISLNIVNSAGGECGSSTVRKLIIINERPKAFAGKDLSCSVSEEIVFDASGSFDVDGVIETYEWDFGDGNTI